MQKCSNKDHSETNAIIYCYDCKIYMCNKCEKNHSDLFKGSHDNKLIKDINNEEIFSGICKELDHAKELIYFCKTHNVLCCVACIAKVKTKTNGQHKDCDVCLIEDIENDKKSKLNDNIKCLEDLSRNFKQSIQDLEKIFKKITDNKEQLKKDIQKIFSQLRNELNNREDILLLEVDTKFEEMFFKEDIIKQNEKLENKIISSINKGKLINEHWNENKLNSLINDCLNIENHIKNINKINETIKKNNTENISLGFYPDEKGVNQLLENIKIFGSIGISGYYNKFDSIIQFNQDLVLNWLNNKKYLSKLLFRKSRDGFMTNVTIRE